MKTKGKQTGSIQPRKRSFLETLKKDWSLWTFCIPGIILTFIFSYIPMYGVQIAFRRFNAKQGIWGSPWVGLRYFQRFIDSPYFVRTVTNTLILSIYGLIVSFPIPILLALMLNAFRHKRYRKVIQTITYAPNFISTIVMCGMLILFLSPSVGIINTVIKSFGGEAINFMAKKEYWRHLYVWSGVWQGMGWSSVIYFAALSGISPELHEAAKCDGATKFQQARYITIPSLKPIIIMMFILAVGGIFSSDFGLFYQVSRGANQPLTPMVATLDVKIYQMLTSGTIGLGKTTAASLFQAVVGCITILTANAIVRKYDRASALI